MIELKVAEVREGLYYHDVDGTLFHFDGAVAEVIGEGGEVFNYTIRLDVDWRNRPYYVRDCLEKAKRQAFTSAVRASLG